MFKNYLKVAARNLLKQRIYSGINVLGLSFAIACCTLVIAFVQHELTFDRYHRKIDSIFRVQSHFKEMDFLSTPDPLAPALADAFPEVNNTCRLSDGEFIFRMGDKLFKEELIFADPSIFEMFTIDLLQGNPATVFAAPNNIVLSQQAALKYFNERKPTSKILTIGFADQEYDFKVAGIAAELPSNSSLQFDFLVPFESSYFARGEKKRTEWMSYGITTLLELKNKESATILSDKLGEFIETYMGEAIRADGNEVESFSFSFQPLADFHLSGSGGVSGLRDTRDPAYLYVLSFIAFFVLLIACFNFTNLSIGQASGRFKEVGMRKVVGARRHQLIRQFWFESLFISLLALFSGLTLAELFLPIFSNLTDGQFSIGFWQNLWLPVLLLVLVFLVGIGAGSYPALILSGFRVTEVLKGKLRIGGKNLLTRSIVVIQFCLSVILIISTIIMNRQQNFMRTKNLGFDKEQVVVIPTQVGRQEKNEGERILRLFKNKLQAHANILNVTGTSNSIARGTSASFKFNEDGNRVIVFQYRVDVDYISTLDIQLKSGRNFLANSAQDLRESIIVNEAFLREFDIADRLSQTLSGSFVGIENPKIIGVTQDYHFQKLHSKIYPMILYMAKRAEINYVLAKVRPENLASTLSQLEGVWNDIQPNKPFDYSFLDEDVDRQYQEEQNWSKAVGYASILAIFIACLGLLGLTMLTVARRTKEIGVRKVLGASVLRIIKSLSFEFVILVAIANLIAWPLVYVWMNTWLQDFAYRIDISPGYFLIGGVASLLIAIVTLSFQSIKAAMINPVEALRYE